MDAKTRRFVRERAKETCEYCQILQAWTPLTKLQVEHVIPVKHRGSDEESNLALACASCNLHKGSNLTGIDPDTNSVVPIFNPRTQNWDEHFEWDQCQIKGKTAVGRTTVWVLNLNSDGRILVRKKWRHPRG